MADSAGDSATRPSLLLRLRDPRDDEAWRTFVDVYGPLVYAHCRRRGLKHDDAEDLTQKTFGQIVQSIRAFDYQPSVGRFRDWLGTLVRNEVNRFLRKASREVATGGTDGEGALGQVQARREDTAWNEEFNAHILQVALTRSRPHFEEATWRAFELVWREKRPAAQVAQELGQPIDWVYVAKSRVLKQLWQQVEELAADAASLVQA